MRRFANLVVRSTKPTRRMLPLRALRIVSNFKFSTDKKPQVMPFQTETKKLLDIVAKSLYTDAQVFIRQLLSNASDSLEKQRFKDQANQNLFVNVELKPQKHAIVFTDNGIGMNKEDLISNLGTIARSGSKQFVQKMSKQGTSAENIIGQFGVGFYSSFIVADKVQVISRAPGSPAYLWSSEGHGEFEIAQIEDNSFQRGTQITLYLKDQHKKFVEKSEVQKVVQKYSNFINFPISLNGQTLNLTKALWTRDKNEISEQEYQKFYEHLTGSSSGKYKYKMHFQSDVPLSIKAVLYIPTTHGEKMGLQQKGQLSLYSKKILIRKNCKDVLIPNFLRFVKGVVDCEDIPLNVSRENYQDSALMNKLKHFLTKKILKMLKDQASKNPEQFNKWYADFHLFFKEGAMEPDFKKDAIELNRFQMTNVEGFHSLKDYVKMKHNLQDRIFYLFSPNRAMAKASPYLYPLAQAGIPVLIANTHVDQIIFQDIDTYQGMKFSNIETDTENVQKILKEIKGQKADEKQSEHKLPQEQITTFSLWIKNQLQPFVDKVVASKRKLGGTALVISPISSSMRQLAFMQQIMEENMKAGTPRLDLKNLTFEYNPESSLIVKLNQYRKVNNDHASLIVRQIFDNCCIEAGLQTDGKTTIARVNEIMGLLIDKETKANNL